MTIKERLELCAEGLEIAIADLEQDAKTRSEQFGLVIQPWQLKDNNMRPLLPDMLIALANITLALRDL